ncbi:MAG: hypothetical protein R3A13_07105 [Bdellovibrionota bacterium]
MVNIFYRLSKIVAVQLVFICSLSLGVFAADQGCAHWSEAVKTAEKIRGLKLKQEVQCLDLDRKSFTEQLSSKPKPLDELRSEELIFKSLGLIPKNFNYLDCAARSSTEFLVAYYDTASKKIYVNNQSDFSFDVLVHEAVHAIQDQHFNLEKLGKSASRSTDTALAFSSVVEGDAMLVQNLYLDSLSVADSESKSVANSSPEKSECNFPKMYQNLSLFSYSFGSMFCKREYLKGGFKRLNSWLINPPKSTRQIIHARNSAFNSERLEIDQSKLQEAFKVKLRKKVYSDEFGQYFVRALVGTSVDRQQAIRAGTGWLGDKIELYSTSEGSFVLAWKLLWENEQHAEEFYQAIIKQLTITSAAALDPKVKSQFVSVPGGDQYYLKIDESEVVLLFNLKLIFD